MTQYEQAQQLVKQGLLVCRSDQYDPKLQIMCYTQEAFFGSNWNDITLTHRGQLYYDGVPVNKPFTKIFNVNETKETKLSTVMERMEEESYEIFHKANGHLFIVSRFFVDGEEKIVYSTKGSLPNKGNDLLNNDIEVFNRIHGDGLRAWFDECPNEPFTMMFEAIVEHDKHTLYEKDLERYNGSGDMFILLGVNHLVRGDHFYEEEWLELDTECIRQELIPHGFIVVEDYTNVLDRQDPMSWLDHTNTEGYVLSFEDGSRVKFKTKEYWAMRMKKDLSPERILGKFRAAGYDRLDRQLPEEIAVKAVEAIRIGFAVWCVDVWGLDRIDPATRDEAPMRDVMLSEDLTKDQKEAIAAFRKTKGDYNAMVERQSKSREKRQRFYDYCISCPDTLQWYEEQLKNIFDNYGKE